MTTSTLYTPAVASILTRLAREADANDPAILEGLRAHFVDGKFAATTDLDPRITQPLANAFIPVSPDAGRLLYVLARSHGSKRIVEFGTSFGISTIHLAAAARDNGGRVVSTELEPEKVRRARAHVAEAGLADLTEIREGDALETLRDLEGPVDFLFLDGWKSLYLPVLKVVEPKLRPGALIVADDLDIARTMLTPFLDYVRAPENGYASVEVPLGDAMEISVRTR